VSNDRQAVPEAPGARRTNACTPPRLMRVTVPEAVALLGLPDPKAAPRPARGCWGEAAALGLGEPVSRVPIYGRSPPASHCRGDLVLPRPGRHLR
jgi:hypothetical protein